ncbi:PH domain-containing protein [Halorubrum amylolyticum]|uniref:PH domain-containing protein n=1 Tax=Halorubrum amylolyticum TaxID=2508724 RepID=UPI0010089B78|nr:PH domain-containing protein [Halorubrum amylolyticum]
MKLAPQSVPYRALQKVSGIVVVLFFVVNNNPEWGFAVATAVAGAVVLAAVAYDVAYYRRFDYELTDDTLDISSGVISRREREIPYRRIQNVDVSRSVIQRAIGVAAVNLETAGGSSTEGSIRYVVPDEATRLQREVQRRKSAASSSETPGEATDRSGSEPGAGPGAVGPTEEELFAISPGELALVGALSFDGRLIGLLAFLSSGSVPVLSSFIPDASAVALTATAIVGVGGLFLVSWVLGAGIAFSNYYGFRLSRAGDELRYERGLFRRYSGSIPTEKVQALRIADNPAKRALGYASLSIETAGYAPGQGGERGSQAAVPIAATDRVYRLAREVESFGDPSFHRPPKRIRWRYAFRYTLAVGALVAVAFGIDWYLGAGAPWYAPAALLLAVPPAAHLKWKHRGYWLGEDHLLTRNGFWSRTVTVVPYYRIQNVIDTRTVFQRRWDVATIVADTAGSSSIGGDDAAAVDFATDEAVDLRETLRERLRVAVAERRDRRDRLDGDVEGAAEAGEPIGEAGEPTSETGEPTDDGDEPTSGAADEALSDEDDDDRSEVPDDGVIRPDFSGSGRDYSEPAERIDTGEYAVDRNPSDLGDGSESGDEDGDGEGDEERDAGNTEK